MSIPPVQFALIHSTAASSFLIILTQRISAWKKKTNEGKLRGKIFLGTSTIWGIALFSVAWVVSSGYIALVGLLDTAILAIEVSIWFLIFLGSMCGIVDIFLLVRRGELTKPES